MPSLSEPLQYIAIFGTFATWFTALYQGWINPGNVVRLILCVAALAMVLGIVQWLPTSWSHWFCSAYVYSDWQLSNCDAPFAFRRVPGAAHMATANGGLAAFFFIFALLTTIVLQRWRILCSVVMFLAIANVIASQSRMGCVTIAFGLVLTYIVACHLRPKNSWRYTVILVSMVAVLAGLLAWQLESDNAVVLQMVYRWTTLSEQLRGGGNRLEQIFRGLSYLDSPYTFLFGISSEVRQNISGFWIEIEPVEVLVLYGAVGWLLQYGMVLYLLIYFCKRLRTDLDSGTQVLIVTAFVCLLSYQVFSIAYYFFRDVFVGTLPWMTMGAAMGAAERGMTQNRCEDPVTFNIR
ncbi:MAG TPA: hypothetical protein VE046_03440 [Steroidobacteraceae bacterium]|nr:hypothetical protein [Steroidobacteraceae bacterium]